MGALISKTDDLLGDAIYVARAQMAAGYRMADEALESLAGSRELDGAAVALTAVAVTVHCLRAEKKNTGRALSAAAEALQECLAEVEVDKLALGALTSRGVGTAVGDLAARLRAPARKAKTLAAVNSRMVSDLAELDGRGTYLDFAKVALTVVQGAAEVCKAEKTQNTGKIVKIASGFLRIALSSGGFDEYVQLLFLNNEDLNSFIASLLALAG